MRAAAAVLLLALAPAAGAEPLVTDRPDFTESAETVPARRLQLEGGFTASRAGTEREHALGEVLLRAGLAPRLELRLGLPTWTWGSGPPADGGLGDAGVGVKLALLRPAAAAHPLRPAAALIAASSAPTGQRDRRAPGWEPEAKLCLAWDLAPGLALASNLNAASRHDGDGRAAELSASVSLARGWTAALGSYLEWFGFAPTGDGAARTHFLSAGATLLAHDDLQLDARAGAGLHDDGPDWFAGLGLARRW